jgi:hypothetical protein
LYQIKYYKMLKSLELRWFIKDILPTVIYKWFTDILLGNETFEEKSRSDYYLTTQRRFRNKI